MNTPPSASSGLPSLSIVVPTLQEMENLPSLVERIERLKNTHVATIELLLMDDDSQDGTREWVAQQNKDWVRILVGQKRRGLSAAVIDGLKAAQYDVFVVMNADLSHPPEQIPEMVQGLLGGADFVIGSRYVRGGSTDLDWGIGRWLNSKVANWMARPLIALKDPLSGFFTLQRHTFERGKDKLNPVGYKIGLELLVKCSCVRVREIPYHFTARRLGSSKLRVGTQLRFIQHLRRLYMYRFGTWAQLVQFLGVGLSGTIVNLVMLTLLLALAVPPRWAVAGGIGVSLVSNFFLNRRFTFSKSRGRSIVRQFIGFVAACSVGLLVNYWTVIWLENKLEPIQRAALVGIVVGTGFNFVCSRFLVFES